MTSKTKAQIFISAVAILIGVVHVTIPTLKIDSILVTLLIISIIPWLEPLLKSVELPGGLKVEFHELEKIEKEAVEAGLIKNTSAGPALDFKSRNDKYLFVEIAENNQGLALVGLRIEIEKRLREIADKYSIASQKSSVGYVIKKLMKKEILSIPEMESLNDMIDTLNQAAHGLKYDKRNAVWVIQNGPKILDSLDKKLGTRSGRFSVGSYEDKEHWISKSYRNCKWTTNYEWGECIRKHKDLWEKEMNRIYESLVAKLDSPKKELLIEAQEGWLQQYKLEQDFLYSFDELRYKVGREGVFISAIHFMNKFRERTLELEEILIKLVD